MKQTAVEWLNQRRLKNGFNTMEDFQQAKQMEKDQTIIAYLNGWHEGQDVIIAQVKHINSGGDAAGEQYYNETYGGDQ